VFTLRQATLFGNKIVREDVFKSKKDWESMEPTTLEAYANKIFLYYRQEGFPYYNLSDRKKMYYFRQLREFSCKNLVENDVINQTMHGPLAWSYFPHAWSVRCGSFLSPMNVFTDDKLFKKAIHKRLKIGSFVSDASIRKILRMVTGAQSEGHARPSWERGLYTKSGDSS